MLLDIDATQVALVLFAIAIFICGLLLGGFVEWARPDGSAQLRRHLNVSEREVDDLRDYIWLVSASTPTTGTDTTAGALPTESVEVERSRHLNHLEDN